MGGVKPHAVDVSGNDEREELFAGPHRFRLNDGRNGELSVPGGQEHDEGHHVFLRQEDVALRHLAHRRQRVLHDTHDGLVRLRSDDLKEHKTFLEMIYQITVANVLIAKLKLEHLL